MSQIREEQPKTEYWRLWRGAKNNHGLERRSVREQIQERWEGPANRQPRGYAGLSSAGCAIFRGGGWRV